jgi:hypothetical protein
MNIKGTFKLKSCITIKDMVEKHADGLEVIVSPSDLAVQNETHLLQFDYHSPKGDEKKYLIKKGIFNLEKASSGIICTPLEMKPLRLLDKNKASQSILNEFNLFFNKLDVYEELDLVKKRGILLYGPPGTGKTANISRAVNELTKNDDTTVISWNASSIRSSDILDFFSTGVEYDTDVKKLIIIIEDIGMGVEGYGGPREIDRSLLNLLDGSGTVVKVPTLFIATTNYAQNLPEPLIRQGRFDQWVEVSPPNPDDRVDLFKFISKEDNLSEKDIAVLKGKDLNGFSVADLKELSIRCRRDGITVSEAVKQLADLKKRFSKGFENKKSAGFMRYEDDSY